MGGGLFSEGPVGSCLVTPGSNNYSLVAIVCIRSWTISRVRTETAMFFVHQYSPSLVQFTVSLDSKYVVRQINFETIQAKQKKKNRDLHNKRKLNHSQDSQVRNNCANTITYKAEGSQSE